MLLSYYLLFSPAFEVRPAMRTHVRVLAASRCGAEAARARQVTLQPPLRAVRREAAPIPVLGAVADKMVEVLESSVQLHAYTSSL